MLDVVVDTELFLQTNNRTEIFAGKAHDRIVAKARAAFEQKRPTNRSQELYCLIGYMIEDEVPEKKRAKATARLYTALREGPMLEWNGKPEYYDRADAFLRTEEGKAWLRAWFEPFVPTITGEALHTHDRLTMHGEGAGHFTVAEDKKPAKIGNASGESKGPLGRRSLLEDKKHMKMSNAQGEPSASAEHLTVAEGKKPMKPSTAVGEPGGPVQTSTVVKVKKLLKTNQVYGQPSGPNCQHHEGVNQDTEAKMSREVEKGNHSTKSSVAEIPKLSKQSTRAMPISVSNNVSATSQTVDNVVRHLFGPNFSPGDYSGRTARAEAEQKAGATSSGTIFLPATEQAERETTSFATLLVPNTNGMHRRRASEGQIVPCAICGMLHAGGWLIMEPIALIAAAMLARHAGVQNMTPPAIDLTAPTMPARHTVGVQNMTPPAIDPIAPTMPARHTVGVQQLMVDLWQREGWKRQLMMILFLCLAMILLVRVYYFRFQSKE